MNYQAVLFDLDGTLADTIGYWNTACLTTLRSFGVSMTEEEFLRDVYTKNTSYKVLMNRIGVSEEEMQQYRRERDAMYCNLLRQQSTWYKGARALVEDIQSKAPVAIMTGSWRIYVDAIDEKAALYSVIPDVITHDDADERSKPDPHGILLAAEKTGVDPSKCMYIGDQLFDMEAAKSAGMDSCLIIRETTPKEAKEVATYVTTSFDEVRDALAY